MIAGCGGGEDVDGNSGGPGLTELAAAVAAAAPVAAAAAERRLWRLRRRRRQRRYGGGGGSGAYGGGGGGGYSGGGSGGYSGGGGGGGSIIDSSAIALLAEVSGVASPDDSPNGDIIITAVPVPEPSALLLLAVGVTAVLRSGRRVGHVLEVR